MGFQACFIGIGSNVGDRLSHLRWAVKELGLFDGLVLHRMSSVYESEAHTLHGSGDQDAYLNAVVWLQGTISPIELLELCMALELERGRARQEGVEWEPRTLDLDILAFDEMQCTTKLLTIPHPHLSKRRFVLEPWNEIAPDFVVPAPFGESIGDLLTKCEDFAGLYKTSLQLLD